MKVQIELSVCVQSRNHRGVDELASFHVPWIMHRAFNTTLLPYLRPCASSHWVHSMATSAITNTAPQLNEVWPDGYELPSFMGPLLTPNPFQNTVYRYTHTSAWASTLQMGTCYEDRAVSRQASVKLCNGSKINSSTSTMRRPRINIVTRVTSVRPVLRPIVSM